MNWALNIFLYLMWVFNPPGYQEWKDAGAPCMVWIGGGSPTSPQPVCFYDPSNTNQ